MLAGMQLDVFTPLQAGPKTGEEIAHAIGVSPARLRLLLYSLVAAGLLNEHDGNFSNTPEASHFLVKGIPSYMGDRHAGFSTRWAWGLKTAESIRTGVPQAKIDFSNSSTEQLDAFMRQITASSVAPTLALLASADYSFINPFSDLGCG